VTQLKCALVGIATGTALAIAWVVGCLFLPLLFAGKDGGLGASSVGSDSTMRVWLAGFVIGFWFARRRLDSRRQQQKSQPPRSV
jgi:hypothetical protein